MAPRPDPLRPRRAAGHLRARELIGFPLILPPWATRAALAGRRRLRALHRASAPPVLTINEAIAGLYDNRVLGLIVELGIPDLLDRPRTAADLAERLGGDADPDALDRILRYAASRQFVAAERGGRYGPTPVSRILRSDREMPWGPLVARATSEDHWRAWRNLDRAAGLTRDDAHPAATTDAEIDALGTTVQAVALSRDLDWRGVETVCDVGGGNGAAIEVLLRAHPHLRGVVLDRPAVIAAARAPLAPGGDLADRCRLVAGDFDDAVPGGCDRYLLVAVLTACDDEQAVALLRTIRRDMPPGAHVLVVDHVLPERPRDELAQVTDLLLLVHGVGRERTAGQYRDLAATAGFGLVGRHDLFTGSLALELARR